jgi:hypothetical protein
VSPTKDEAESAQGRGRDQLDRLQARIMVDEPERTAAEIARWLIADARVSLAPLELIDRFCRQLVGLCVPLWRLRAGQRLANPLASAWGVIWTRDGSDTHEYVVPRTTLSTGALLRQPLSTRRRAPAKLPAPAP